MTVPRPSLHHLALTVTDLDASVAWYSRIFDVQPAMDVPHPGGLGRVLLNEEQTLAFALHHHDTNTGEQFAEVRTGLDHFGLMVATREDLERWQNHLSEHGVQRSPQADRPLTQSPITDEPYGSVLTVRDPDNIPFELFSPPPAG